MLNNNKYINDVIVTFKTFLFVTTTISFLTISTIEASEVGVRSGGSSGSSLSQIRKSEFTVSTGHKTGYFTYQIGGLISAGGETLFLHFPLSELRFPLDAYTVRGSYLMELNNQWRIRFEMETNYSSYSGKMEDSDWGVKSLIVEGAINDPESLDIFSRTRSDLSLKDYSLHFEKMNGKYQDPFGITLWSTYLGFGMAVQDYDFEMSDGLQIYPSTGVPPDTLTGKGLIYNFFQITPYISVLFKTPDKKQFQFSLDLSLSPFVHIADYDNHILRNKISDGSTDGWSAKSQVFADWQLNSTVDLFLTMSSQYTKANGWQIQTNNDAGSISKAKVKLKHISQQNNVLVGIRSLL